ncbi:magnesium transporter [Halobaculum roseum]|uniref:Magnesium transporter n=1 Tax=Halobaculum roseum TaxID=2175149 RepID=A0ABD5MQX2_9EURY|nr:magnesium transporter [Halobaculum roseum]QZY01442.1 magnesium transporter [Halobaculum roseum]
MGIRETAGEAYREALPALATSAVGGLLAGVVLGGMRAELRAIEGLLVLVPALLATRGSVFGSFGARISTGLHQGIVEPRVDLGDDRLRAAAAAALANGVLVSLVAAVLTVTALTLLASPVAPMSVMLGVALIASVLSGIALTAVVLLVVFAGYRRGYNPDTFVGPVVTTTGDVAGVFFLLIAARAVLALAAAVGGGA